MMKRLLLLIGILSVLSVPALAEPRGMPAPASSAGRAAMGPPPVSSAGKGAPLYYWASTYYADTTAHGAAGTTCSLGSPCTLLYLSGTKLVTPGDIGIVKDGTYQGANDMASCYNHSGTAGNLITLKTLNDGAVLIDGQDTRAPWVWEQCSYWDIEGFNAANSGTDEVYVFRMDTSGAFVHAGDNSYGSNNNVIKRICGWDAADGNSSILLFWSSKDNSVDGFCGFGVARKIAQSFARADNNFVRNAWMMWNYSTASGSGPHGVFSLSYDSSGDVCANCIFTWDEDMGADTTNAYGLGTLNQYDRFNLDGIRANHTSNSTFIGGVWYQLASFAGTFSGAMQGGQQSDGIFYKHIIAFIGTASGTESLVNLALDFGGTGSPVGGHTLTNITAVRTGGTNSYIEADWTVTGRVSGTSILAATGQIDGCYVGSSGAKVRYLYDSSLTITSTPMWPFSMNQRAIDAQILAGRTPKDPQANVESFCGPSPDLTSNTTPPIDTFESYVAGDFVEGLAGGSGIWTGDWTESSPGVMTIQSAPSGGGLAVRSNSAAGGVLYASRNFAGISTTSTPFSWGMRTSITNPNSSDYGVIFGEAGVADRAKCHFMNGANIECYNYDTAAWVTVAAYSANTTYSLELELDAAGHPDAYRVRANGGSYTAWLGANGTMSVLNIITLVDSASNAHTLWFDSIGSTVTSRIPVISFDLRQRRN